MFSTKPLFKISFLALLLGLFSFLTPAALTAAEKEMVAVLPSGAVVTLSLNPCSSKLLLEILTSEAPGSLRDGKVQWEGRELKLCWKMLEGDVAVIDEGLDQGVIPLKMFDKKAGGI